MSQISVNNLTFCYEGSFDNIFENVSFAIDTDWKLGFIGRNGKGKTTFLNLLLGKYEYEGSISKSTVFDYFPYEIKAGDLQKTASELMEEWKCDVEEWRVIMELSELETDAEVLYRPFESLSFGERTKVMLAVLFSSDNNFLLIDEPSNHLDKGARECVKKYLARKKGFILVSHDRDLLDACTDHVLVLNRSSIEVQNGNFSSWWENKERKDAFSLAENEKHLREIGKLKEAADRVDRWAAKSEATKIGLDPIKEHDRCINARSFIGAKTKKMQSRVKNIEKRIEGEIAEKEGLLNDIEKPVDLKLMPMDYHKETLVRAYDLSMKYKDSDKLLADNLRFELKRGERLFIKGENGCGKSTLIKLLLEKASLNNGKVPSFDRANELELNGSFEVGAGLTISYINQDTSHLKGKIKDFCRRNDLDESLLYAILRQLDMSRIQFEKNMEDFSEGQKKKVLIASSLLTSAHLYIWDEPLNYIDVFSRMQLEKLLEKFSPTMIIVEHDVSFSNKLASNVLEM